MIEVPVHSALPSMRSVPVSRKRFELLPVTVSVPVGEILVVPAPPIVALLAHSRWPSMVRVPRVVSVAPLTVRSS